MAADQVNEMVDHDIESLERITRFSRRNASLRRLVLFQAIAIAVLCMALLGLVAAILK